jgi:hypothetical protein
MEISVSLPLDNGFLRRQCPQCDRQFKWHHGPTDDRPADFIDPPLYHCPYCGQTAGLTEWTTAEQREFMLAMMAGPALREVAHELGKIAKGANRGLIQLSVQQPDEPEPPDPLIEPHDMVVIASPCHPWEPIKAETSWREPFRCLVCGAQFAI